MGACYSKNTASAGTPAKNTRPKQKNRDSTKSAEWNGSSKQSHELLDKPVLTTDTFSDADSGLSVRDVGTGQVNEKVVISCVVPSDSGIVSISNVPDDSGESPQLKQKDELLKLMEQSGRDLSQKCGSSDLDVGSRQVCLAVGHNAHNTKDSSIANYNSRTQHDERHSKDGIVTSNKAVTNGFEDGVEGSKLKQNLQTSDSSHKDILISTVLEDSLCNTDKNQVFLPSLESCVNHQSNTLHEKSINSKAPLAAFDSIEANLNDSSIQLNGKRQSLLSEILDLTESLCKCDFYSTDNCSRNHGFNGVVTGLHRNGHGADFGASGQFSKNGDLVNQLDVNSPNKGQPLGDFSSASASRMSSTPSKKMASLPKNVSFAAHEGIGTETSTDHIVQLESRSFKLSSDKYSHRTASEIIYPNKEKDLHKRSASLGSVKATMSDSSSDAPDCTTEDDLASMDLDNISRVTSISYNSIRQLVESTENLVSPRFTVQPLTVDGVDCVVIPRDAYRQMQMDLATLRQQLIYLSSLMQEGAVDL